MRYGQDGYRDARTCANCDFSTVDLIGNAGLGYRCTVHNGSRCSKRKVCDLHEFDGEFIDDTGEATI